MAITVRVVKRPESGVSYLRASLKGMGLSFRHLFRKKVTMQYPEETTEDEWKISSRWRGTHRMLTDAGGRRGG
jgi:NADH-quinone oxidoreductase subunit I